MFSQRVIDTVVHRWLQVPYELRVTQYRHPRRPIATIVLIHGIGNSSHSWEDLIPMLPKHTRVVAIDLLGFGRSPKPAWGAYSAKAQARSVMLTLFRMGVNQRVYVVGHSLGALIAVEMAKRYPLVVRSLVLCSPPFYRPTVQGKWSRDEALRRLYRTAHRYPERLVKLSPLAVRVGLANKALRLTDENIGAYVGALEASIINQTSVQDALRLKVPTRILYGTLDPIVIGKNITDLAKANPAITAKRLLVGHEISGLYTKAVAKEITALMLASSQRNSVK